jgi:WS/DGAT/MGAT family acyltransferase
MSADPSRAFDLAGLGVRGASALGKLVFRWPDPKTIFKGDLGEPKRAAWSEPLALSDIKAVGQGLEGTVNDVLLTAMAGALRRYLQGRGECVDGLNFRAVVPVDLRQPDTYADLGNKFGLVFLALPLGIADPGARLHELKRRMDGLKGSLEAPVGYGILNLIGMSPQSIQDVVVDIFGTKGTAVMTNVIGPREPLYLAGAPLESLMFWVPQSGHLGLGVSILSYAGQVWLGVISDQGLVPDPETIVSEFHIEFNELLAMARGREGMATIKEMSAMLDSALAKVDAILDEQAAAGAAAESEVEAAAGDAHTTCQALTKAGKPCKNRALPGSEFCRVHQG